MESIRCFVSLIDLISPSQDQLLTYDAKKNREFNIGFMNAMGEIMMRHNGRLLIRSEGFVCYFPGTSDQTNVAAFQDALECCLEQWERVGSLSHEMWKLGIRKTSYQISADYEVLYKITLDDAFNNPNQLPLSHLYKISSIAPWGITIGDSLYKIICTFPEFQSQFKFRKVGGNNIDPSSESSYPIYLLNRNS